MAFDYQKALSSGANEDDVLNYLTVLTKYNSRGAIEAGANKMDVIKYLSERAQNPIQQKEESKGILRKIVEAPFETLIAKPAVRFGQALAAPIVYGLGDEATQDRYRQEIQKNVQAPSPLGGTINIEPVKGGVEGVKQIAGEALDTASYLIPGGKVAKSGLGIKAGMASGAASGFATGAGQSLQEGASVADAFTTGIKTGAVGLGAGGLVGAVPGAVRGTLNVARGTQKLVTSVAPKLKNIPSNIATNAADRIAVQNSIKALPKAAQDAANKGIAIEDANFVANISPNLKAPAKKLFNVARNATTDAEKIKVQEAVGAPMIKSLRTAQSKADKIGAKLQEESRKLNNIKREDAVNAVVSRLKKVPGLQNIEVSDYLKGNLKFDKTTLSSELNPAAQAEIQTLFKKAIKTTDGESKHLLRQEIFEMLGGKKSSQAPLTATQEKALEAIRNGLFDVLGSQSKVYKKLSTNYAKIINPVKTLRKILKADNVSEDLLEMKAGALARRLTSNAPSRAEIQTALTELDNLVPRKSRISVAELQNLYNVMDKYIGLSPSTSLRGEVAKGVGSASDVGSALYTGAKNLTGETPAVRRKALEDLLDNVLGK